MYAYIFTHVKKYVIIFLWYMDKYMMNKPDDGCIITASHIVLSASLILPDTYNNHFIIQIAVMQKLYR